MSDFIREVDEEYRRDRVVGFLSKYQLLLVGIAVAIVLGTAGYRLYLHYQNQAAEAANSRYAAAIQLGRDGKSAEAQAAFDAIQRDGPAGYAMLARMKAVEALAMRDPAAAASGFDAIAQDSAIDPALRDAAQIRGAMIRVDIEDPKAFETLYGPLAVPGFVFRSSLRELLALAAFKRNDTEAAGRWLDEIVIDQQAPSAVRSRAEAFLSLVASGPAEAGTPEAPKPVLEVPPGPAAEPAPVPPTASTPTPPAPPAAVPPTAASPSPTADMPRGPETTPAAPQAAVPPVATPPAPVAPPPAATPPAATPPVAAPPVAAAPSNTPTSPSPAGTPPAH